MLFYWAVCFQSGSYCLKIDVKVAFMALLIALTSFILKNRTFVYILDISKEKEHYYKYEKEN